MNIIELQEILKLHKINLTGRALAEIWGMNENTITNKKRLGTPIKVKYLKLLEEKFHITLLEECLEDSDFPTAGERVKFIRESMHMSQEEFAELIGVSRAFISTVEKNKANLSVEKLTFLLNNYNVSANYILGCIGRPFLPKHK